MKSSREQFEEWYLESWGQTEDDHETMFERDPDFPEDYYRLGVRLAHHSWQASRAAIEIELPEIVWDITECGSQHYDVDDVKVSIHAAGLTVKGDE